MRRTSMVALGLAALISTSGRAQGHAEHTHEHGDHAAVLGSVSFDNSGKPAAQPAFHRGIALLHSFEYIDAGDAFREAQRLDPDFALAYWMEALTTEHPLWGEFDLDAARIALSRLAPSQQQRLAKAATERERRYGAAIEALFATDDRRERLLAYADSMRRMPDLYPDDLEASAFASIAALTASYFSSGADRARLVDEAIARGESVFARNQQHPGAAHYLIHAYDTPQRAARGLPFARVYAQIAPAAEHALHMPSHIFVQVGMWEDVVNSNERAWAASRAWVARRGLSGKHLDFHSLQWLQYGYLQQGRYRDALAVIDTARLVLSGSESDRTGGPDPLTVITRLAFQYAAETGDWSGVEPAAPGTVRADGTSPRHEFFARVDDYQHAVFALRRGRPGEPTSLDRGEGVLALQIEALRARARGNEAEWISTLRRAVEAENNLEPTGPPLSLVSHELLADGLLALGDAAEAVTFYEQSLTRRPRRPSALLGLARAHAAAGAHAASAEAYRQLSEVWSRADTAVSALIEAQARGR